MPASMKKKFEIKTNDNNGFFTNYMKKYLYQKLPNLRKSIFCKHELTDYTYITSTKRPLSSAVYGFAKQKVKSKHKTENIPCFSNMLLSHGPFGTLTRCKIGKQL